MHAPATPPQPEPPRPYYLIPPNGGKPKECNNQWQALIEGYLTYGMTKFRVLTEEEFLLQP